MDQIARVFISSIVPFACYTLATMSVARGVWHWLFGRLDELDDLPIFWRVLAYLWVYAWGFGVPIATGLFILDAIFGWGIFPGGGTCNAEGDCLTNY